MSKRRSSSHSPKAKLLLFFSAVLVALAIHLIPGVKEFLLGEQGNRPVTPADGNIAVHFIDVGQGDATLIISHDGTTMLIDTGTSESRSSLPAYIRDYNITTIDYLVLTHPHADHIGSAVAVLEAFDVKQVLMPDATATTVTFEKLLLAIEEEGCGITTPGPKDTFTLGDAVVTVLGPVRSYTDLNAVSIVLRLDYGSTSFLFTGDAEAESEADMLDFFAEGEFRADVWKLGHHGSSTSSSEAFSNAVSAKYAVVSCGKDNEYGHPHAEILADMTKRGIALYRTDLDGTILLASDGEKITVLKPSSAKQ